MCGRNSIYQKSIIDKVKTEIVRRFKNEEWSNMHYMDTIFAFNALNMLDKDFVKDFGLTEGYLL